MPELDPQTIGNDLKELLTRNDGSRYDDAKKFMLQLNTALTNELSISLRDTYIINIFNNQNGILHFLESTKTDKYFKEAKKQALEVLYTLINNFPKLIKNADEISNACLTVYISSMQSDEKTKALDVITLILERFILRTDVADKIYNTLCERWFFEKTEKEKSAVTKTMGVIAKKYPYCITSPEDFLLMLLKQLKKEVNKENSSQPVIRASFDALSNFFDAFPYVGGDSAFEDIFKCIWKIIVGEPKHVKIAQRAALYLLGRHCKLMEKYVISDIKQLHTSLLKYFEFGHEEHKAVFGALISFYRVVANFAKSDANQKQLTQDFHNYFLQTINKRVDQPFQHRSTIFGIGIFAAAFHIHLSPDEYSKTTIQLLQAVEHNYLINPEESKQTIDLLPTYIQAISHFMISELTLTGNQIHSFQQLLILMIKTFPQLSTLYHKIVVESFVTSLFHIWKLREDDFGYVLNQIVLQGVIWSCSYPYPFESNEEVTSYKSFLPFWVGIFEENSIEKSDMNFNERYDISKEIFDQLIKSLLFLINKLNLNTRIKESEIAQTNPDTFLELEQVNDFGIFLNVVDLYREIITKADSSLVNRWILTCVNQLLLKISKHPLISGFYKLLATFLEVSNSLRYFQNNPDEEHQICIRSIENTMKQTVWKMKQFSGELQIACLEALIACPPVVVVELLPCIAPAFVTLFNMGRSYLPLASKGLDALKCWIEMLPKENMRNLLKQVLPHLDAYLKSKSLQQESLRSVVKTRKTKQVLKKRKVLVESEPELLKLQKEILVFVGSLSGEMGYWFVDKGNEDVEVVYKQGKYLKTSLPYEDFTLGVYLDDLLPRLLELAQFCSNRKVRVAACELLHSIVMLLLGTSRQMGYSSEINQRLKSISMALLRLGCDLDEPIQQIFKPLVLSLIHWYTSLYQFRSAQTEIIIESLLNGITNPDDSSLRDFSGVCIKEFVVWTIKQMEPDALAKDPANIKALINKIISFSLHCDSNKRLGASLIFNNIYVVLREEAAIFDMFWLELLYAFVMNVSLVETVCLEDNNCLVQVGLALKHLERGFVEKCGLFNEESSVRRLPPGFDGVLLKDVAMFLLRYVGSKNPHCREKTRGLFERIAPLVKGCNSVKKFVKLYLDGKSPFTGNLKETISFKDVKELFEWLENFHCTLDGLIFVTSNGISSDLNEFTEYLIFYLLNVENHTIQKSVENAENSYFSVLEKEHFNASKYIISIKLLKLCVILLKSNNLKNIPNSFWNEHLYKFICNIIFQPNPTISSINASQDNKHLLIELLKQIKEKLPFSNFSQIIKNHLINTAISQININEQVPQKQRLMLKGMLLLQETAFADVIDSDAMCDGFVLGVFEATFDSSALVKRVLNFTSKQYCGMKLELAVKSEKEFLSLVKCIFDKRSLRDVKGRNQKCGLFFFCTFKEIIAKCLIERFELFVEICFREDCLISDVVYLMMEIVKFIADHKKEVKCEQLKKFVGILLRNWKNLEDYFNTSYENVLEGINFIQQIWEISPHLFVKEESGIAVWIQKLLTDDLGLNSDSLFTFRLQLISLLPCIVGYDQKNHSLKNSLRILITTYLKSTRNISEESAVVLFKKLLDCLNASKSVLILEIVSEVYIMGIPDTFDFSCNEFMKRIDTKLQITALEVVFKMLSENYSNQQKHRLASKILRNLLLSARYQAFEIFYKNHILQIDGTLKKQSSSPEIITQKAIGFLLVGILFFRVNMSQLKDSPIIDALYDSEEDKQKFTKNFTTLVVNTCRDTYNPTEPETKELFRIYQCESYNAFVSIATTIKKEPIYKLLFRRDSDSPDLIWRKLLNLEETYQFPVDFDSVPTWKKKLAQIRSEIKQTKRQKGFDTNTVNYLQTHSLFNSSLSEDVQKFDFTNSMLRVDVDQNIEGGDYGAREIQLEAIDINNHECMVSVCGLIEYLVSMVHVPEDLDDLAVPEWLKELKMVIASDSTHRNVKVFLCKVLENCSEILQPFGRLLAQPVMKIIVDGLIGSRMNYFIYDLIVMLSQWTVASVATFDDDLPSELLKFLIENTFNDRRDMYKSNLELLKTYVEALKKQLNPPHQLLVDLLGDKSMKADAGCQISFILAANEIMPWGKDSNKQFLTALAALLKRPEKEIYIHAAEVVGLMLKIMSGNLHYVRNFNGFSTHIYNTLDKIKNDQDRFLYCLEKIVLNYPQICDNKFLAKVISGLSVPGYFKCMSFRILIAQENDLRDLNLINFPDFLTDPNEDIQVLALELILKKLFSFDVTSLTEIVRILHNLQSNCNEKCRGLIYSICMKLYERYNNVDEKTIQETKELTKTTLTSGLLDSNQELQNQLFSFFSNEHLPNSSNERLVYILNHLYNPSNELHFLGCAAHLLLDVLKSAATFEQKIFEYPLEECDFQEQIPRGNWKAQHASVVPMFADTLRTQTADVLSELDFKYGVLRETQQSLVFQPTKEVPVSQISSSLMVGEFGGGEEFKDPNKMGLSVKYKKRFVKDKSKMSKTFAQLEVKKVQSREKKRLEQKEERERGVQFYRRYRVGDFPDIGVALKDVILPLQILAKNDADIARVVVVSLFDAIVEKINSKEIFLATIRNSVNTIFQNSTQFVPNVIGTFFDLLLSNSDVMRLEPDVITAVCKSSGLVSVGTLLLENYLISGFDEDESTAKKSKGNGFSVEQEHWAKLAELYKELDEWDVVKAIFLQKMNSSEALLEAIHCESQSNWKEAQEYYKELLEQDASFYNKDFYLDSYFKCFENLAEWDQLTVTVKGKAEGNFWDQEWKQRKLLPRYIKGGVRSLLVKGKCDGIVDDVNLWLEDEDKLEYLKANFSEELAVLFLMSEDFGVTKQYLQNYMANFLEFWPNLNSLFGKLRYGYVLKVRNVAELSSYLEKQESLSLINCEEIVLNSLKHYRENSSEILNDISLNETQTLYYLQFINSLKQKSSDFQCETDLISAANKTSFQVEMNLIKAALHYDNFHVAKKYYNHLHAGHKNSQYGDGEEMNLKLLVSKLGYLKSCLVSGENRLEYLMKSWRQLDPVISYSKTADLNLLIQSKQQLYKITSSLAKALQSETIFEKYKPQIDELAEYQIPTLKKFETYGIISLQDSVNFCNEHLNTLPKSEAEALTSNVSEAYVTLAYFAQNRGSGFEKHFICSVLRAMKLNSLPAIHLFPCLLDVSGVEIDYKEEFVSETKDVAVWMFLRWIPQLLALVDSSKVTIVSGILLKIAETYPQSIMYAYRLSKSTYENTERPETKELIDRLDALLMQNELVDIFLKALSYVCVPESMLYYYVRKLMKACILNSADDFRAVCETIKTELFSEIADSKDVRKFQGNAFKKIKKKGEKFEEFTKRTFDAEKFKHEVLAINNELKNALEKNFSHKLAEYSPWLNNFHASKLNADIEIPGQYTGLERPLIQYHVKISSFSPEVKIMTSLRKPIRVTIIGNDAKEYPYLVKFGEDLRQDQRIQQLLHLIKGILKTDPEANRHDLTIETYQVVPLSNNLGLIEWVDSTVDLSEFILFAGSELKETLEECRKTYNKWINDAKPRKDATEIDKYGSACIKYNRNRTIAKYQELVNKIPWNVFRTSFKRISPNSEKYFALRNNFIKSYSTLCASHWLLGIGDRHLENTMISLKSGRAVGIDFGHAFGTATQLLPVPEMVPFRLTPHLVNLMLPLGERGLFKETMVKVLRAIGRSGECLLSTANVFIKEPSLEWREYAVLFEAVHGESKMGQMRRKLEGVNPVVFVLEDLEANRSLGVYREEYVKVVKGDEGGCLRSVKGVHLNVEEQVDCLIDLATDCNVLGRIFAGYKSWV